MKNCIKILLVIVLLLVVIPAIAGNALALDLSDPLQTNKKITASAYDAYTCEQLKTRTSLDLNGVINFALCNNPETHGAWANVLAAAAQLGTSQSGYLPRAEVGASLNRSRNSNNFSDRDSDNNSWRTAFTPQLSLSYLLYDFGGREAMVRGTERNLNSVNYSYNSVIQNIIFNSLNAYYNYAASKAGVDAALEAEKSSRLSMEAADFKYKIGSGLLVDKLQAETAYSQSKLQRIQAENQQQVSRAQLMNVIGFDANAKVNIIAPAVQPKYDGSLKNNIDQMIEYAKQNRPDLIAARETAESQKENIAIAKAQGWPSISAVNNNQYNRIDGEDDRNSSQIGVELRFPLFTGFSNTYQIKNARENYAAAQARSNKLQNDVTFDVWETYQNFETATQALSMTSDLLKSAAEAENVALGRYKKGVGSLIDLLNAQAQLASARQQRVQAVYNWFVTKADLLRSLGNINVAQVNKSFSQ